MIAKCSVVGSGCYEISYGIVFVDILDEIFLSHLFYFNPTKKINLLCYN